MRSAVFVIAAAAALGLLADSGPAGRNAGLAQQVRRNDPALPESLLAALADPDPGVRQIAIANLDRAAGHPRLVEALRSHLAREDPATRWLVIRTIARIPEALIAFSREATAWARDPDPLVRRALLAHIEPGPGVLAVASPLLEEAVRHGDITSRMSAADSLARLGLRIDPAWLATDLVSESETAAGAASYALWRVWDPAVERAVVGMLGSRDPWGRARAAELLRKRGAAFDPIALTFVFRRGGEGAQLYAAGTLSRVQTGACVPPLRSALASRFGAVRQAAVYALEAIEAPAALEALTAALRHTDANVRYRTAVVLGRMRARPAAAALQELGRQDSDPRVRGAARIAAVLASGGDIAPVLPPPAPPAPPAPSPFAGRPTRFASGAAQIGFQKQLFADDGIVENAAGVERVVHRFRKDSRNPVLEQQFPWELQGVTNYCAAIEYDAKSGTYRMWYLSYWRIPGLAANQYGTTEKNRAQLLAVSADGVNWARPNFSQIAFDGSTANNLVGTADNLVRLPDGRYASYAPMRRDGKFYMAVSYSPDGVGGWTAPEPVMEAGGDVGTLSRDDLGAGFLGFTKWRVGWWLGRSFPEKYDYATRALLKTRSTGFRSFAPVWGPAPTQLTRGPVNLYPGPEDDRVAAERVARAFPSLDFFEAGGFHSEVYQVLPFPYEGLYFAFPIVFTASGRGGANDDGTVGLSLVVSRDPLGKAGWSRPGGKGLEPVLDLGRWGEWDSSQIYAPSNLLVVSDEIVLYYNAAPHGHEPLGAKSDSTGNRAYRSAIGRAVMRLDGMVSLRSRAPRAEILTKPLHVEGGELEVNLAGELHVELVDPAGTVLDTSHRIRADRIRERVRWTSGKDLGRFKGGVVRLRFRLAKGDIFSFRVMP